MIQTIGSLMLIVSILLPIAACGAVTFKWAMDAHADFYRYEQSHQVELLDESDAP
jgi:hypothetical protein